MALQFEIYKQCHEHLKETHKKRDQIVTFFLAVVAVLIGLWAGDKNDNGDIVKSLALGAGLVGLGAIWVIIAYRRWHIIYNNAIVFFEAQIATGEMSTLSEAENLWNRVNDPRSKWEILNLGKGLESGILVLVSFIVMVPWNIVIHAGVAIAELPVSPIITWLINTAIFLVCVICFAAWYLKDVNRFEKDEWMYRWIRVSVGVDTSQTPMSLRQ